MGCVCLRQNDQTPFTGLSEVCGKQTVKQNDISRLRLTGDSKVGLDYNTSSTTPIYF